MTTAKKTVFIGVGGGGGGGLTFGGADKNLVEGSLVGEEFFKVGGEMNEFLAGGRYTFFCKFEPSKQNKFQLEGF